MASIDAHRNVNGLGANNVFIWREATFSLSFHFYCFSYRKSSKRQKSRKWLSLKLYTVVPHPNCIKLCARISGTCNKLIGLFICVPRFAMISLELVMHCQMARHIVFVSLPATENMHESMRGEVKPKKNVINPPKWNAYATYQKVCNGFLFKWRKKLFK